MAAPLSGAGRRPRGGPRHSRAPSRRHRRWIRPWPARCRRPRRPPPARARRWWGGYDGTTWARVGQAPIGRGCRASGWSAVRRAARAKHPHLLPLCLPRKACSERRCSGAGGGVAGHRHGLDDRIKSGHDTRGAGHDERGVGHDARRGRPFLGVMAGLRAGHPGRPPGTDWMTGSLPGHDTKEPGHDPRKGAPDPAEDRSSGWAKPSSGIVPLRPVALGRAAKRGAREPSTPFADSVTPVPC
jgi:hypothetical protein